MQYSCNCVANGSKSRLLQKECKNEVKATCNILLSSQGAEQCGFCNPGFMMNTLALLKENPHPSDDEIKEFLAGNLCRVQVMKDNLEE